MDTTQSPSHIGLEPVDPVLPGLIFPPLILPTTTVVVSFPTGGTFLGGSTLTVQWSTSGPVASHTVLLSLNGGAFSPVPNGAGLPAAQRQLTVELPVVFADVSVVVRVRADDFAGNRLAVGDSPALALRPDIQPPAVGVIAPNGGEVLQVGQSFNLAWNSSDNVRIAAHRVLFSPSGGAPFATLANLDGNARGFAWTVPDSVLVNGVATSTVTNQGVIRVEAMDPTGNGGGDRSDGLFQVRSRDIGIVIFSLNPSALQAGAQNVRLDVAGQNLGTTSTLYRVIKLVNGVLQASADVAMTAAPQPITNGVRLTLSVAPGIAPSSSSVRYFVTATDVATGATAQSPELFIGAKAKDTKETKEIKDKEKEKEKETKEIKDKELKEKELTKDRKDALEGIFGFGAPEAPATPTGSGAMRHFIDPALRPDVQAGTLARGDQ